MLGETKLAFTNPAFVEHPKQDSRFSIQTMSNELVRSLVLLAKAWTGANVISSKYCVERDAELWSRPELWLLHLLYPRGFPELPYRTGQHYLMQLAYTKSRRTTALQHHQLLGDKGARGGLCSIASSPEGGAVLSWRGARPKSHVVRQR
jgi:hypothetical protein